MWLCGFLLEEENHIIVTHFTFNVKHEKYDDLLNEHDHLSIIFKSPSRRVRSQDSKTYVGVHYFYIESYITTK